MAELHLMYGISDATFNEWRLEDGELDVSSAKRLRSLAAANVRLKLLLAKATLDISILKEMLGKNF